MKNSNKNIGIITRMNEKVDIASEILETTYAAFDKGITLPQPFYGTVKYFVFSTSKIVEK